MRLRTLHDLDQTEGTVRLRPTSPSPGTTSTGPSPSSITTTTTSTRTILLHPTPSPTDPNDPLRWPRHKKHAAFLSICTFTFLTNFGIYGLAPAFYLLSLEFDKTLAQTSDLVLWPMLVGIFNFLWVPLANHFGKRPVFVFCSGLLCACFVWGAVAGSFESLLWSNVVAAFAASATEALGASMVNDLYFLHERGAKMGLYMNFICAGNTLGPLVCGFVITGLSWRWHKWIAVILTGINFLTVLLFVPETRYYRNGNRDGTGQSEEPVLSSTETMGGDGEAAKESRVEPEGKNEEAHDTPTTVPKKSWIQELSLWSGTAPDTNLAKMFIRPLPMFAYPCVIYALFGYAASLVLTMAVNILNPFVLQAPPYSWSPMINGLINIPGFIGNVVGSYAGGWLVDVFCDWKTRRNKGVFEPESRLYLCALPLFVTGAGCIVFGYGVERMLHWTSLFIAYGMISVALTAIPTITMAYVSDCLLPVNSDALMLVNGLKNVVTFGFLYGIVPWVEKVGYVECFGTQAGIFAAIIALGMAILIPFGGKIRHIQARWRIIL